MEFWNHLNKKQHKKDSHYHNESSPLISALTNGKQSNGENDQSRKTNGGNTITFSENPKHIEHEPSIEEISNTLHMLDSEDDELNHQVLRVSLDISNHGLPAHASSKDIINHEHLRRKRSLSMGSQSSAGGHRHLHMSPTTKEKSVLAKIKSMLVIALLVIIGICVIAALGTVFVGPPLQPVGPYEISQVHGGNAFWNHYSFYEGPDSLGSNGYINYASKQKAFDLGIANVTVETVSESITVSDDDNVDGEPIDVGTTGDTDGETSSSSYVRNVKTTTISKEQPFVYMSSAATPEGPRDSIRLEGKTRFNRGLFLIDLDHMPAGCGTWPAFWLTDEDNWPINGEIDILEGVNFQTDAKTALHTSKQCDMSDVPKGVKNGSWDTAVGVPDSKTGKLNMTPREARNCYVYDPHQWLNQGCVAIDDDGGTIGVPFNQKGGGVYALEWDPINKHIRSWVFSPHSAVPDNLKLALDTAGGPKKDRVAPDPSLWPLPFGYFPIGTCMLFV